MELSRLEPRLKPRGNSIKTTAQSLEESELHECVHGLGSFIGAENRGNKEQHEISALNDTSCCPIRARVSDGLRSERFCCSLIGEVETTRRDGTRYLGLSLLVNFRFLDQRGKMLFASLFSLDGIL